MAERATPAKASLPAHYVVLSGLVFGPAMGALLGLMTGSWHHGFYGGVLSGLLFGWGIKSFFRVAMSTTHLSWEGHEAGFEPGETVLHYGGANHFKGVEAVGGKLFLTSFRLRFRSHAFNAQPHDESYPLKDVLSVEPVRTMGFIPNGIDVLLRDGRHERFVVLARGTWIEALRRQLDQLGV